MPCAPRTSTRPSNPSRCSAGIVASTPMIAWSVPTSVDLRAQKPVASSVRAIEGTTVSQIARSAVRRLSVIHSVMLASSHLASSHVAKAVPIASGPTGDIS